jgi:signal transduction histidine kinase
VKKGYVAMLSAGRITEKSIFYGLTAGFALVVLLLGTACIVAIRAASSIERNTSRVVGEQLLTARLLNEIQAEQDTLTEVLHSLARQPYSINRSHLIKELDDTDAALSRMMRSVGTSPEAALWHDLQNSVRTFSTQAREAIRRDRAITEKHLDALFASNDAVVRDVHELLESSSARVFVADTQIAAESRGLGREALFLLTACLALAVICAAVTVAFARHSIRRMEWQASELNRVSWHMLQGQEEAARRFSHELHDELGQSLAAVKANLTGAAASDFLARRADCIHLVDEAIANVRELAQLLRPVILDDFGLDASLRWLSDKFSQRTGIAVDYRSDCRGRLADETETHLFRIAQEALTNIARHSGASNVSICMSEQSNGSEILLTIEDNGRGMPKRSAALDSGQASLGLTGMRGRASQAGGDLRFGKPQDSPTGLRIEIRVPARSPEPVMEDDGEYKQQQQPENSHSFGG